MTPDSILARLSRLSTLIDYRTFLNQLRDAGILGSICRASALLTFLFLCISLAEEMIFNKGAADPGATLKKVLPKAITIAIVFGITPIYSALIEAVLYGLQGVSNWAFYDALSHFQADFRFAVANILSKQKDGVSFFAPEILTAPFDLILLSLAFNFVIAVFFALISYPAMFIVIALASGPILVPFSLFSPFRNILQRWALFVAASGLFTFFVGIALQVIVDARLFAAFAELGFDGSLLPALVSITVAIAFMLAVPIIVAFIFRVPVFSVLSVVFAGIAAVFGFVPIFAKVLALLRSQKGSSKGGVS